MDWLILIPGWKVSDFAFEEFNGFPGRNGFNAAPKLAQRISSQLLKPFTFDYVGGHVSNIRAAPDVSETVVNMVRGILDFLQVTVKTTARIYDLEEVSPQTLDPQDWTQLK